MICVCGHTDDLHDEDEEMTCKLCECEEFEEDEDIEEEEE